VTAVARLLADHTLVLRLGGGLIMLAFAVVIWRSSPKLRDRSDPASIVRLAVATLTLTLTNPATILFFVGAFGAVGFTGIGHDTTGHLVNAGLVVAGTFTGSMLWWVIVTGIARRLRGRITDRHLLLLNRGTAIALAVFAVAAAVSGVTAR
jgi:threonine/homoserine/homoserine lactone efflux protein